MRRLLPLFGLLLAAVWLPATQHCALEATGLFANGCPADCRTSANQPRDGCGPVEDADYKPAADTLKVATPALIACVFQVGSQRARLESARGPGVPPDESVDRPRDWVSTWHFVRRAAPSPRAPSRSLA